MIIEFMEPDPGAITPQMTRDMLALAGARVAVEAVEQWTPTERVVAFDWAAREHLVASDNEGIELRHKPWFVTIAQRGMSEAAFQLACERRLHQYGSEYTADHLTWRDFAREVREVFEAAGITVEGDGGR